MTSTATRLLTLITLLQRQPGQKAADLAHELGVSVRTLHRYFGMLDEMGIPVYTERGPYGGFSLVRGYKLPPLIFSPEEAVAIYLGTSLVSEMWGQLYQDAAAGALAKIESVLPDEQRSEVAWARRSLVTLDLHRASQDAQSAQIETLRSAVRGQREVDLLYQSALASKPGRRRLDPYALVYRWGWWYVVGYCHKRAEVRTFRVDRIHEVTMLAESFQIPPDFNTREYLAREFQGGPQVKARVRFMPEAAHGARANHAYWDSFEEQPDGSVVVGLSAPDLIWAASSVLMYGPAVEVLEPLELRMMVRGWARATAALYPESQDEL
jgi:predicted DNA-binding transcriptional regulator YafY